MFRPFKASLGIRMWVGKHVHEKKSLINKTLFKGNHLELNGKDCCKQLQTKTLYRPEMVYKTAQKMHSSNEPNST